MWGASEQTPGEKYNFTIELRLGDKTAQLAPIARCNVVYSIDVASRDKSPFMQFIAYTM